MAKRIIIGTLFIAFALLKLGDILNLIHCDWLWRQPWTEYIGPAVLLYLGLDIIVSGFRHRHDRGRQRPVPTAEEGKRICCTTRYGGDEYVYHGEPFHGAKLDASFGGIRLDLRNAVITEDEAIDIHTFMGGVELYVPTTVNVVAKGRSIIGGISNHAAHNPPSGTPCLHIVASNFMGGVSIKNV